VPELPEVETIRAQLAPRLEGRTLVRVEGATHFFDRKLSALGDALRHELAVAAGGTPTPRP